MLISLSHRFIFFHVGKTGGMSVREALRPYCQDPEKFKMRRPPRFVAERPNPMYSVWETLLLHAKASDARKELHPDVFNGFYKFAFVRNPWDLQVSMYHFILREPNAAKHDQVKALGSFDTFIDWVAATPDPYPRGITKLQSEMIASAGGELLIDFVGRYESLEPDFQQACQVLKIEACLPHLNKSKHVDYRGYYNERTRSIVGAQFERDIELFGYTFDGVRRDLSVSNAV